MKLAGVFKQRSTTVCSCIFAIVAASPASGVELEFQIAGLRGTAWLPDSHVHAGPVILYSHGFHGCPTQSRFLAAALASAGYAVLAPSHADATCGNLFRMFDSPEESFWNVSKWDDATYALRMQDLKKVLDNAPHDARFADFDWKRVGLAGYSLGGYTALGMAGGWETWKDRRVVAVLAVAPYAPPFIMRHTLGAIGVPVMFQAGTRDGSITPFVKMPGGAFDATPAPKLYIELSGAGHLAWTDGVPQYHALIDSYAVAFFDTWLKDKTFPQDLLQKSRDVSDIRVELN